MTTADDDFRAVPLNSLEQTACSPAAPSDPAFRGIVIRAPSLVRYKPGEGVDRFGSFAAVPICAYFQLDVLMPTRFQNLHDAIRLVAVDRERDRTFAGLTVDPDPVVPPPHHVPPKPNRETWVRGEDVYAGFFNPNLVQYARLPRLAATYEVFMELDGSEIRSNTVTVRLEPEPLR